MADKGIRNFSSLRQPRLAALARNDKIGVGDCFARETGSQW